MYLGAITAGGLAALAPAFIAVKTIIVQGLFPFLLGIGLVRAASGVQGREGLVGLWTGLMNGEKCCRRLG